MVYNETFEVPIFRSVQVNANASGDSIPPVPPGWVNPPEWVDNDIFSRAYINFTTSSIESRTANVEINS